MGKVRRKKKGEDERDPRKIKVMLKFSLFRKPNENFHWNRSRSLA